MNLNFPSFGPSSAQKIWAGCKKPSRAAARRFWRFVACDKTKFGNDVAPLLGRVAACEIWNGVSLVPSDHQVVLRAHLIFFSFPLLFWNLLESAGLPFTLAGDEGCSRREFSNRDHEITRESHFKSFVCPSSLGIELDNIDWKAVLRNHCFSRQER